MQHRPLCSLATSTIALWTVKVTLTLAALPGWCGEPAAAEKSATKSEKRTERDPGEDETDKPTSGGSDGGTGAAKGDSYTVVQVGRTVKVLKSAELPAFRKQVAAEHELALKEHNEAKQKAAKSKKKFDAPKPEKPVVKLLASSLKSEESANALRQKTVAAIEKKRKKEIEERAKGKQKAS